MSRYPNTPARHSHFFNLNQPSGSGSVNHRFKASLRRIPSALFHKDKTPAKQKAKLEVHAESCGRTTLGINNTTPKPMESKARVKSKPRKALAEIFGWGNPSHPKVAPQKESTMQRANTPDTTRSTSLRLVSCRRDSEMVSRPSMGDDPFMRSDSGVEVIDSVLRSKTLSMRSATPFGRRSSTTSSNGLSCKMMSDGSQERSCNAITIHATEKDASSSSLNLSSISRSFGKINSARIISPLRKKQDPMAITEPSAVVRPKKLLKKEKTKSKVWSLLGKSKPRRSKSPAEGETPPPTIKDTKISAVPSQPTSSLVGGETVFSAACFEKNPVNQTCSNGPHESIEALIGPARLPKRKSLTGLFGLHCKKSFDKMRSSISSPSSPPCIVGHPALKALAEEIEEYAEEKKEAVDDLSSMAVFTSHWGSWAPVVYSTNKNIHKESGLRRVASATDKLLNLVHVFDSSPTSRQGSSSHPMTSVGSRHINHSPIPLRKARSGLLDRQSNNSSLRPLKYTKPLEFEGRQTTGVALEPIKPHAVSPPRNTMVREGIRNIFAPPSPVALQEIKNLDQFHLRSRPTIKKGSDASDIPLDLKPVIDNTVAARARFSPEKIAKLGLPAAPPRDRTSSRRAGLALPVLPMSSSRDSLLAQHTPMNYPSLRITQEYNSQDSMFSDMLTAGLDELKSSFDLASEYGSSSRGQQQASFLEKLWRVEASQMAGVYDLPSVASLSQEIASAPHIYQVPSFHISKPSDGTTNCEDELDEDEDYDEAVEEAVEIQHVVGIAMTSPVRHSPFKGQVAFQQHMSMKKASNPSFVASGPTISADLDPLTSQPRVVSQGHGHQRGQSSVGTMSSIGSVIGNEREYTNYFEYDVPSGDSLSHQTSTSSMSEALADETSLETSLDNNSSSSFNSDDFSYQDRTISRPGQHCHAVSIQSIDSIGSADVNTSSEGIPPFGMYNGSQEGCISRHCRGLSSATTIGRPDWAGHHYNASIASTVSNISVSQIVRPGLGDRMFQLDGGVQLTSITGSPPPECESDPRQKRYSWDSLFDEPCSQILDDSLFNPKQCGIADEALYYSGYERDSYQSTVYDSSRISIGGDSLFGPERNPTQKCFVLRGLRHMSTVSTDSTISVADNTFANATAYGQVTKKVREHEQNMLADNDVPFGIKSPKTFTERQMLSSATSQYSASICHRSEELAFSDVSVDTPGLTSPSASESSSRLSLDTNAASLALSARVRGHCRQTSSAQVNIDATIHEMSSLATLRPQPSANSPVGDMNPQQEPSIVNVNALEKMSGELDRVSSVRSWIQWERDTMDEFRTAKNVWIDSEESRMAISDWNVPQLSEDVAAFIAQPSQAYKPLEQLSSTCPVTQRDTPLGDSRSLCSSYGLPLPNPTPVNKPKMSLTTKYEKKSSTSSKASTAPSTFSFAFFPDDVPEAPSTTSIPVNSPLLNAFAPFVPEAPSPSSCYSVSKPSSLLQVPILDHISNTSNKDEDERQLTNMAGPKAKRQALSWSRRRRTDGPEKVLLNAATADPLHTPKYLCPKPLQLKPKISKLFNKKLKAAKDNNETIDNDENALSPILEKAQKDIIIGRPQPLRPTGNRSPAKRKSVPRHVASQPAGLRV
nr:hypothetical protein L203_04280 [Cryptococcus depauperatus CBS 7841]